MVSDVSHATNNVTVTGAVQNAQKTDQQAQQLAGDFDQFLTLLTTQLQNQDPLNPMDSTEFTNQLVQFSQVEQSINTNKKLDDIVSLQLGSAPGTALGYVGMDINYLSSEMSYDGSTPIKVSYALDDKASSARINIMDGQGDLIYSGTVENDAGSHDFVWDGTTTGGAAAPAGTYSVSIDALDADGEAIDTSTVVSGHVRGVESQNGTVNLLVGDRAVPLGQVINAALPAKSAGDDTDNTAADDTGTDAADVTDDTTTGEDA